MKLIFENKYLIKKSMSFWWDNGLYSVNYILNKRWLSSSQEGNIGGTTRLEVEAGQWEQENSGKKKVLVCSRDPATEEARCDCLAE